MASEQKVKYAEIEKAFSMWKGNKGLPDKIEAGWFTRAEFAYQKNISRSAAQLRLTNLIEDGVLQTKKFRILTPKGFLKSISHYKVCKPTKKTR